VQVKHTHDSRAEEMVRTQILARGVVNRSVLEAMSLIPRERFLGGRKNINPYGDYPIPIGYGQTISQPYIVAFMTEKLSLRGHERVLEIGTGSGYQTAVLAELAQQVYTIERIAFLLKKAKEVLNELGYTNIEYRIGDGSDGWPDEGLFDGILVTAAVPSVPDSLKLQLSDNGVLVIPVGDYRTYQVLTVVKRIGNRFETGESIGCRFVPLIGKIGF
jgi:protein-L-isoaspartate(D-aspartate) O-methyltransferase